MKTLLLLLLLAGSAAGGEPQVLDDTGHVVKLLAPARRIVTLAPHATELVLALGLEERLAGVADFSGYPDKLESVPRLSALGPLDREQLLALRPDLVIAWASGNRPGDLRWLERSGIPVYRSEPRRLADIGTALRKLGRLAGRPERGRRAAQRFRTALDRACQARRHQPPLRVFYEIWSPPPITIGGDHWLNDALRRAGLNNLFADLPRGVVTVSRESLLARSPQLVLTGNPASGLLPGVPRIPVDPTLERPGPRVVEGLARLCRNLPTTGSATADRQPAANGGN